MQKGKKSSSGILYNNFQRILEDPVQQLSEDPRRSFKTTFRGSSRILFNNFQKILG
jgi:hypothetical protein